MSLASERVGDGGARPSLVNAVIHSRRVLQRVGVDVALALFVSASRPVLPPEFHEVVAEKHGLLVVPYDGRSVAETLASAGYAEVAFLKDNPRHDDSTGDVFDLDLSVLAVSLREVYGDFTYDGGESVVQPEVVHDMAPRLQLGETAVNLDVAADKLARREFDTLVRERTR